MPEAPAPVRAGPAGFFSDLPFVAPTTPAGWLAIIGPWLVSLAFLLPWYPNVPYFDGWGMSAAGGRYAFAFLVSLLVAILTVLPTRLPSYLRLGVLPFFVGALGLGLSWYPLASQAPQLGVWLFLVGSLLALTGGAVVIVREQAPAREPDD